MAQETRKITFSKAELSTALASMQQANPEFLPHGKVVDCSLSAMGTVTAHVQDAAGTPDAKSISSLKTADVLEALIRCCLDNKVMIPRAGKKTVSVTAQNVALCIELHVAVATKE